MIGAIGAYGFVEDLLAGNEVLRSLLSSNDHHGQLRITPSHNPRSKVSVHKQTTQFIPRRRESASRGDILFPAVLRD
uniref:Uncharacterized protein n=1 Tax=Steinernema glaseri TaxID=37863 RepID=A0A1I7Z926_9BILA